ncbi:MAG: phosphoenolpyruvate--protein phosphotransferase [Acidobacteriota bacterium]
MSISVRETSPEIEIRGLGISPGIAIGTTIRIDERGRQARLLHIEPVYITRELRRLRRAVSVARHQLNELKARMERELGHEHGYILDAHILMLQDQGLLKSIEATISEQLVNAELAIKIVLDRFLAAYASISDGYLRQRGSDIEDVANRLIDALSGKRDTGVHNLCSNSIIVAEEIPPSVFAELDMEHVVGLATYAGGWASHTAIIARSLRIPALVGVDQPGEHLYSGRHAILDGNEGIIILDPTEATLRHYRAVHERRRRSFHALIQQSRGPAVTADGQLITLRANIELLSELNAVQRFGAQGIGLFRSEFIFTNMLPQACSEEGQFEIYCQLAEASGEHGVSIRTFDLSAEKLPGNQPETNPALGLRGIRLAFKAEEMFRRQIRAIIRASYHRNIRVMLPLVSCVSELRRARIIIEEITEELTASGLQIDRKIPLGVMVEVPAAVMIIDQLAREADFLSIGTNDLIQYLLAVDRSNKQVAYLYQPLHPAVLRVLARVTEEAAAANTPLEVCGEMAANPVYAAVLLGLGITRFSMAPTALPLIKDAIRTIDMIAVREIVRTATQLATAKEIEDYLCTQLSQRFPSYYVNLNWRGANP